MTQLQCNSSRGFEQRCVYTDVRTRQYSSVEAFSGDQTSKDKAFDLKLRLWEESYWLPQVAVGARDIGGTGLFDAEYLVAGQKPGGRSILRSAWAGDIWAPAVM
ncbi:YjbH domain-containing protein [Escherichia coli]